MAKEKKSKQPRKVTAIVRVSYRTKPKQTFDIPVTLDLAMVYSYMDSNAEAVRASAEDKLYDLLQKTKLVNSKEVVAAYKRWKKEN